MDRRLFFGTLLIAGTHGITACSKHEDSVKMDCTKILAEENSETQWQATVEKHYAKSVSKMLDEEIATLHMAIVDYMHEHHPLIKEWEVTLGEIHEIADSLEDDLSKIKNSQEREVIEKAALKRILAKLFFMSSKIPEMQEKFRHFCQMKFI